MSKIKKLFTNWRMILLIIFLIFAVIAIRPNPIKEGVAIKSVMTNSSAALAGIENPKPTVSPMSREIIQSMNNVPINTLDDYYSFLDSLEANRSVRIKTNRGSYTLLTKGEYETKQLNETEIKIVHETIQINETIDNQTVLVNKTINKTKTVPKVERILVGMKDIGLNVAQAATSNIRKGLDLQGGTRVILQPEEQVDDEMISTIMENLQQRLNVYGIADVIVREVRDKPKLLGEGNKYILVEIAGVSEEEVKDLLSKQGKFEAEIGNTTVFRGGEDITYVCRTAECSGIDPNRGCGKAGDGYACSFMFSISLTPEAAQKQADATRDLTIEKQEQGDYLSEKLELILDDKKVDELNIASDLQGRAVTEIAISGSGAGSTEQEAMVQALKEMKRLQTILITGSLPVKLNIVKTDNISPMLGMQFVKNALLVGIIAILAVATIIFIRYRHIKVALSMIFVCLSEVILLLGFAALIGWNIDLAAVAGIIIAVGTGVDDQIIITDETLKKESVQHGGFAQKLKRAFFIIMAAYFTTAVAMLPLVFAGAGLLKGFALTTIAGITLGVFITRPAYAALIKILIGE
jgi:preprotein translocase subunit SecD